MEVDSDKNGSIDAILTEVKELEKQIAFVDYELCKRSTFTRLQISDPINSHAVKEQVRRFENIYAQRDEIVSRIPNFWLRVVHHKGSIGKLG